MFSQKVFCQVSFWLVALTLTVTAQTRTENSRAASAASYLERGNQWLAKGDLERALADYDLAIASDPRAAIAYYNRGIVRQRQGEWTEHSAIIAVRLN